MLCVKPSLSSARADPAHPHPPIRVIVRIVGRHPIAPHPAADINANGLLSKGEICLAVHESAEVRVLLGLPERMGPEVAFHGKVGDLFRSLDTDGTPGIDVKEWVSYFNEHDLERLRCRPSMEELLSADGLDWGAWQAQRSARTAALREQEARATAATRERHRVRGRGRTAGMGAWPIHGMTMAWPHAARTTHSRVLAHQTHLPSTHAETHAHARARRACTHTHAR